MIRCPWDQDRAEPTLFHKMVIFAAKWPKITTQKDKYHLENLKKNTFDIQIIHMLNIFLLFYAFIVFDYCLYDINFIECL